MKKSSRSGSYTYYVQNGNIIPPANIQGVSGDGGGVQGVSGGTNFVSFSCGKGDGPCPSAVQGFNAVQGVQGFSGKSCGKGNPCFGVQGVQGASSFSFGKGSKGGLFITNPIVAPITNPVVTPIVTPVVSKSVRRW